MTSSKPIKTLAMRVLEGHGVSYQPVYYEVVDHLSAAEVAAAIGLPSEQTFKTLVVLPDRPGARPILAAPGDSQLDLKKLATAVGEKKAQMAPQREAERLTGLEKGGISPLRSSTGAGQSSSMKQLSSSTASRSAPERWASESS